MKESSTRNIKIIYRGSTSNGKISQPYMEERMHREDPLETRIDFRDQIVRLPLFPINKEAYLNNPAAYEEPMLEWLVGVVETIFSITFRQLLEERLTLEQAKAWACKNLLGNLKTLCEAVSTEVGVVDERLLRLLDDSLSQIISTVIIKYPQTSARAASRRILKFIKKISDRDNDQYDFLLTRGLTIRYRTSGDYSTEIMQLINAVLNLPIEPVREDESLMESFSSFCRRLFFYAHQGTEQKDSTTGRIVNESIDAILANNSPSLEQLDTIRRSSLEVYRSHAEAIMSGQDLGGAMGEFERARGHLFKIGQKIPSEVRQFSEKEVREGQFKVYHAAVLRVLTKWSEELQEKLERAGELIRSRIHKFKTNAQELRFLSVQEKEALYQQAAREKARVEEYLHALKEENKALQAVFAGQHVQGKYMRRFTNVEVFAGKLEEVVAQYTFHYLNRLVHSLLALPLAASQRLYETYKYLQGQQEVAVRHLKQLGQVNLVTFKVGDLMRARYSCEEHEFVNVLGLLYRLEEADSSFLRIVKIKDRMFEKNNDILINFFFRGRTICELQLSIHKEENRKQRLYGDFNHFLYQLKRSQFGIIAEFASIVSQHDPIVNYFTFNQHSPPLLIEQPKKPMPMRSRSKQLLFRRKFSDGTYLSHKLCQKAIERPFLCTRCRNLKVVLNPRFYFRQENQMHCNECIQQQLYSDPSLHMPVLKDLFKYYVLDDYLEPFIAQVTLWDPREGLRSVRDEKQLYAAFVDYGFAIEKGDKLPRVRFFKTFYNSMSNAVVLSSCTAGQIDNFLLIDCKKAKDELLFWNTLDKYLFFATKTINQQQLALISKYISEENCQQDYLRTIRLKEREFLKKEYLRAILNSFEKYHSTLYLNGYKYILEYSYEYLHTSNEALAAKRNSVFLASSHRITSLLLESSEILTLYPFLRYFSKLRELNLSTNHITSIQELQQFKELQTLNISHNKIASLQPLKTLPFLHTIIARGNQIASLKGISQLQTLNVLDCSENWLNSLADLQGLGSLRELTVNKNFIETLEGVATLSKLRLLRISDNKLARLEHVGELRMLETLEAATNLLDELIPLPNLQALISMNFSNNSIRHIPSLQTPSLKELNLSENLLTKIQNLEGLGELISLNLSKNQISSMQGLEWSEKLKKLVLSNNKIEIIQNLDHMKALESFRIENNPVTNVKGIISLKVLSSLSLECCQLSHILHINTLKRLKGLSLAHNSISSIQDIDELVRLQRLDLSFNKILHIENLGTLKGLQHLNLANNVISKIDNLAQLVELNWLVLSFNKITAIQGLEGLTALRVLELEGNHIEQITGLGSLQELEELILSSNRIKKISGLEMMGNLKKLSLSNNQIGELCGLQGLARLELLDLHANNIKRMQRLQGLWQLKWLVLTSNLITRIQGLDHLQQLSKLILSHNQISKIENLAALKVLSALYLDYNQITKLENMDELQNLQKLHLGHNSIGVIGGLDSLEHLTELNLEDNHIQKLEGLDCLTKLKKFVFAGNMVKSIEKLENLKELTYLSASRNQITVVSAIHTLPYLQYIDFTDNPIENADTYSTLSENVRLCIQLIMRKFDSQNIKRTNQRHLSLSNTSIDEKGVEKQVQLIRSFAKSFRPQL